MMSMQKDGGLNPFIYSREVVGLATKLCKELWPWRAPHAPHVLSSLSMYNVVRCDWTLL